MFRRDSSFSGVIVVALALMLGVQWLIACGDNDGVPIPSQMEDEPVPLPTAYSTEYNYDPELKAAIGSIPVTNFDNPAALQPLVDAYLKSTAEEVDTSGLTVVDVEIPGPAGAPDVPIRIFTPENVNGPVPAILDIHGGGLAIGNIDMDQVTCVKYAKELGIVAVTVQYRLTPTNIFPAAVDDCYAALAWMSANAEELNIDPERIAVGGSSAGGNLAAAVALMARDNGGPKICFQLLDQPMLDDWCATESMQEFVDTPGFNLPNAILCWNYYLGESVRGSTGVSPYAAPARAEDLSNLPTAWITANQFDPLRDEGVDYAFRLMNAGVRVELRVYPGTFHGSAMVETAAITKRQIQDMVDALGRGLGIE